MNADHSEGSAVIRQDEDMRRVDCESRREAADFAEFVKRVGHAAGISGKGPGSGTVLPGFCRDVAPLWSAVPAGTAPTLCISTPYDMPLSRVGSRPEGRSEHRAGVPGSVTCDETREFAGLWGFDGVYREL